MSSPNTCIGKRGDCDKPFGSGRFVMATDIEGVMDNGIGCCFAIYVCSKYVCSLNACM